MTIPVPGGKGVGKGGGERWKVFLGVSLQLAVIIK